MVGKIVQVNTNTVVFETSDDRVRIEIAKWGIQSTEAMEQAAAQKAEEDKAMILNAVEKSGKSVEEILDLLK